VDLSKYLGVWYEIASFPGPHQEGCVATKATYRLRSDGDIEVINECRDKNLSGKWRSAKGKAWVVDENTGSKLKVRFFWPLSADYWVIMLGEQYEFAVVSEPNRKYLWILCRSRQMSENTYAKITNFLRDNDFDLSRLNRTTQPAGNTGL
jgi:apolipoprotein D and lipocalin family protein